MNKRPLKPCKRLGCVELTRSKQGYCDNHVSVVSEDKASRNANYDKNVRRGKDRDLTNFYNSRWWRMARTETLRDYKGIDVYGYYVENVEGLVPYADTVHHIVEIRDDWNKRLDADNLFPTSSSNHEKIHSLYRKDKEGTQKMLRELLERFKKDFGK